MKKFLIFFSVLFSASLGQVATTVVPVVATVAATIGETPVVSGTCNFQEMNVCDAAFVGCSVQVEIYNWI
jgi:hypothetical protein